MSRDFSRDNLPRGWTLERWDAAKGEIRSIIWRQGIARQPITYMDLSHELSEELYWQSPVLGGLLTEIALDVKAEGGPSVTAFAIQSGKSRYPGDGFFRLIPENQWRPVGKTEFCRREQERAAKWIANHPEAAS